MRPTPVWLMRQAGRYLPQYRALRERWGFAEMLHRPELCVEATLQPVRLLGVDAAILFSDISVIFEGLGVACLLQEGVGPVVPEPVRTAAAVERLDPSGVPERLSFVLESIRLARAELRVPLIGFVGAPFTLASYLVEGGPSRTFAATKRLMHGDPGVWRALMERLAAAVEAFGRAQVAAGAQALQLFDSWVGALAPADFEELVAPYLRPLVASLRATGVPVIYFGVDTAGLLERIAALSPSVVGVDWRVDLAEAWRRLGDGVAVQGNLDPSVLQAPWPMVERRARQVLAAAAGRPGHVFNLGHGVLPETDPAVVRRLVEWVHEQTAGSEAPGAGLPAGGAA